MPAIQRRPLRRRRSDEWTLREMRLLERHYAHHSLAQLRANYLPNRTAAAIYTLAKALHLTKPSNAWRTEEDDVLRQLYCTLRTAEIHEHSCRARLLCNQHPSRKAPAGQARCHWLERELRILRRHYQRMPTHVLIVRYLPHRTVKSAQAKAKELGRAVDGNPEWTAHETAVLRKHYRTLGSGAIQRRYLPHRTLTAIQKHAALLGIVKPHAPMWTLAEDRLTRIYVRPATVPAASNAGCHRASRQQIGVESRASDGTVDGGGTRADPTRIPQARRTPKTCQAVALFTLDHPRSIVRNWLVGAAQERLDEARNGDAQAAVSVNGAQRAISGRSPKTIAPAQRFGITRTKKLGDGTSGPRWSAREYAVLRKYADLTASELSGRLPGRSRKAIINARSRLREAAR